MKTVLALLVFCVALAGCNATIRNVRNEPYKTIADGVTMARVSEAVKRGAANLGWQIKNIGPGHILAAISLREHKARVDIKFNLKGYSITHRDSVNLNYINGNIHPNYNGWIMNLENSIQAQISAL